MSNCGRGSRGNNPGIRRWGGWKWGESPQWIGRGGRRFTLISRRTFIHQGHFKRCEIFGWINMWSLHIESGPFQGEPLALTREYKEKSILLTPCLQILQQGSSIWSYCLRNYINYVKDGEYHHLSSHTCGLIKIFIDSTFFSLKNVRPCISAYCQTFAS